MVMDVSLASDDLEFISFFRISFILAQSVYSLEPTVVCCVYVAIAYLTN